VLETTVATARRDGERSPDRPSLVLALCLGVGFCAIGCANVLGDFTLGANGDGSGGSPIRDAGGDVGGRRDASMMDGSSCIANTMACYGKELYVCKNGVLEKSTTCDHLCSPQAGCFGQCNPGDITCQQNMPVTCQADGTLKAGDVCTFICRENAGMDGGQGGCTGICSPGSTQCIANTLQTCSVDGAWNAGSECAFVCLAGPPAQCGGVCLPGSRRCNGAQPQACTADGSWVDLGASCTPILCSGAGVCSGMCTPPAKQCRGNYVQNCVGGTWVDDPSPCRFVCQDGVCGGECTPGDRICIGNAALNTCGTDGRFVTSACPIVCRNGACSGVCTPSTYRCTGPKGYNLERCDADGQWQPQFTCTNGCLASSGMCAGCVSGTKRCMGNQPQICDTLGNWVANGSCPGACLDGGVCAGGG
jgi:hypothetical protein